jgi:hypothetical protein
MVIQEPSLILIEFALEEKRPKIEDMTINN